MFFPLKWNHVWIGKGAFKYYVNAFWGVREGLSQNADTADAGEGGGGVSDKMLTLGSEGVEKSGVRAEIKRKLYK